MPSGTIWIRPVDSIAGFLPMFRINAPAVLGNGAVIFDYQKNEILDITYMEDCAISLAREVYEKFSTVGIELYTDKSMYLARPHHILDVSVQEYRPKGKPTDIYSFEKPLTRVVFFAQKEINEQIAEYVERCYPGKFQSIKPFGKIYNLMGKEVTKGSGLIKLCRILGIDPRRSIAIGDSHNDADMLKAAGFCACPRNGKEEIKTMCQLVVGNVMEGAVADLIEYTKNYTEGEL